MQTAIEIAIIIGLVWYVAHLQRSWAGVEVEPLEPREVEREHCRDQPMDDGDFPITWEHVRPTLILFDGQKYIIENDGHKYGAVAFVHSYLLSRPEIIEGVQ